VVHKCVFDEPRMMTVGARAYVITAFWSTGTATFFQAQTGQILVQRKDGTWKVHRPKKHIVLSNNPRVKTFLKARDKFNTLDKALRKKVGR